MICFNVSGSSISIHAPLTGCDGSHFLNFGGRGEFQSTHPSRGATIVHKFSPARSSISIHAPLTGCDYVNVKVTNPHTDFNPRTPHGVRLLSLITTLAVIGFQSTHPSRGATPPSNRCKHLHRISIHAPLTGCDRRLYSSKTVKCYFNPRTPHGVRLWMKFYRNWDSLFQSTHPSRGATGPSVYAFVKILISIHAPLTGCDPAARTVV